MERKYWIDSGMVENHIRRAVFALEREQAFARDPNFYAELLGRALLTPITLEYASKQHRYTHVITRLQQAPDLRDQAKQNLAEASELARDAATAETQGPIELVRESIPQTPPAAMEGQYELAAQSVVEALEDYAAFLGGISADADWRFDADLFEQEVRGSADVPASIDETLTQIQAEFDETYSRLIETAKPIHGKIYGAQAAPRDFALMRDILDVLSADNRLRAADGLLDRVRRGVKAARQFNIDEEVAPAPPANVDLAVSDTPPFLRTKYPVSPFQAPPFLDP